MKRSVLRSASRVELGTAENTNRDSASARRRPSRWTTSANAERQQRNGR